MRLSPDNNLSAQRSSRWTEEWQAARAVESRGSDGSGFVDLNVTSLMPIGVLPFEVVDQLYVHVLTRRNVMVSWYAVALYLVALFVGKRLMRTREAFKLRRPLIFWNCGLFLFSLFGAFRVVPQVVLGHWVNPPAYFVCRQSMRAMGDSAVYFWMMLFVYSKFFELIDTAFLVLRKRPVNFLHYFHHATVLLYCWDSWAHQTSTGIYFGAMNYIVHSIMYFYYTLAAFGHPPRWGILVTVLQIVQMFFGIAINIFHYSSSLKYENCDLSPSNVYAAITMYTAYMALFVNFFLQRYGRSAAKRKTVTMVTSEFKNENGTAAPLTNHAHEQKNKSD